MGYMDERIGMYGVRGGYKDEERSEGHDALCAMPRYVEGRKDKG